MWSWVVRAKLQLTWVLEQAVVLLVAALVLDVLWGVCSRFVLEAPSRWTEEVATFLLIWVALLGAAVAFCRDQHLGLDYFVKKLDIQAQRVVAVLGQCLVLVFSSSAMVLGGYILVSETLASGQVTPSLGVKMGYVYLAVPVSGVFINIFCIERILEIIAARDALAARSLEQSGGSDAAACASEEA